MSEPMSNVDGDSRIAVGPSMGDAFGAMLMECWERGAEPGRVPDVIERDDGFLGVDDGARYFALPESWGELDRWSCEQARGRALDIGSGAGRHSLHLQDKGLEVVALDVSPLASEVCRRRGVRQVVTGAVADLLTQNVEPFDSFLMMGNNLGLLSDPRQAQVLLRALAELAAPGAVIIGQGMDPYRTENRIHLAYHERNRSLGRMPGQIRMRARYKNLATDWFDYLFASIEELRAILAASPWRMDRCEVDGPNYVALLRQRD